MMRGAPQRERHRVVGPDSLAVTEQVGGLPGGYARRQRGGLGDTFPDRAGNHAGG
jgi:hypothetical protein